MVSSLDLAHPHVDALAISHAYLLMHIFSHQIRPCRPGWQQSESRLSAEAMLQGNGLSACMLQLFPFRQPGEEHNRGPCIRLPYQHTADSRQPCAYRANGGDKRQEVRSNKCLRPLSEYRLPGDANTASIGRASFWFHAQAESCS